MSPPRGNFEKLFQDLYLKMLELVQYKILLTFWQFCFVQIKQVIYLS